MLGKYIRRMQIRIDRHLQCRFVYLYWRVKLLLYSSYPAHDMGVSLTKEVLEIGEFK